MVKIARKILLPELRLLASVAPKESSIPVLGMLYFETKADALAITATDLEMMLCVEIKTSVSQPSEQFMAPVSEVLKMVTAAPANAMIRLEATPGGAKLTIEGGASRGFATGDMMGHFPEIYPPRPQTTQVSPTAFTRLLETTLPFIAKDDRRYTLNGALLEMRGSALRTVSTDGHRLGVAEAENGFNGHNDKCIMPKGAATVASKMLRGAESVGLCWPDADHLKVEVLVATPSVQRHLGARALVGQFPNYEVLLPKTKHPHIEVDALELSRALKSFTVKRDTVLHIRSQFGELHLSGDGCEQTIACAGTLPCDLTFNADHLQSVTATMRGAMRIHATGSLSVVSFFPAESDQEVSHLCLLMPMDPSRIKAE